MEESRGQSTLLRTLAAYTSAQSTADYTPEHFVLCAIALFAAGRATTLLDDPSCEPLTEFESDILSLLRMLFNEEEICTIGTFYNTFVRSPSPTPSLFSQTLTLLSNSPPRTIEDYLSLVESCLDDVFAHSDNGYVRMSELLADSTENILEPPQFAWHSKTGTTLYVEDPSAPPPDPPSQPALSPTTDDPEGIILHLESSESLNVSVRSSSPQSLRHIQLSVKITQDLPIPSSPSSSSPTPSPPPLDWLITTGTDAGSQRLPLQPFSPSTSISTNTFSQLVGQNLILSVESWRPPHGRSPSTIHMGNTLSISAQKWFFLWYMSHLDSPIIASMMIVLAAQTSTLYSFTQDLLFPGAQIAMRTIMLTQPALEGLWLWPGREMVLGQMAGHTIGLKRAYVSDPVHEARVRCLVKSERGRWSVGPEGLGRTYEGVGVFEFLGSVHAVYSDPGTGRITIAKRRKGKGGAGWEGPEFVVTETGEQAPRCTQAVGVCVVDWKEPELLLCYRDEDGYIHILRTQDLSVWTLESRILDIQTPDVPALASLGPDKSLHLAYRLEDNTLHWATKLPSEPWSFTQASALPNTQIICGPHLHVAHKRLYLSYVSSDLHIRLREFDTETNSWSPPFIFSATHTSTTSVMAGFKDDLMIAIRSMKGQGTVQLIKWDCEGAYEIEQLNGCHSIARLGMGVVEGSLWVTYSDMHS